jgi:hypothetical protein
MSMATACDDQKKVQYKVHRSLPYLTIFPLTKLLQVMESSLHEKGRQ